MAGNRLFFLVQLGRKEKRVERVIPLTNSEEAIDRANRELKLALDGRNVIDYLNFYYTFTPKDDPVPSATGSQTSLLSLRLSRTWSRCRAMRPGLQHLERFSLVGIGGIPKSVGI